MKVEIPEFRRCCYCIPLRYGLLVWGYIKLVLTLLVFLLGSFVLQMYMQLIFFVGFAILPDVLLGMALLIFLLADIAMTVVFLIGGHRKTIKLLRIFYIYSIVFLAVITVILFLSTVLFCILSARNGYNAKPKNSNSHQYKSYNGVITTEIVTCIVFLGVHAYIILLIRSEINKLGNSRNFRFTNIAAEEGCTMENINQNPTFATRSQRNGIEDDNIGMDDQLEENVTKPKKTVTNENFTKPKISLTNEGTFTYDKF